MAQSNDAMREILQQVQQAGAKMSGTNATKPMLNPQPKIEDDGIRAGRRIFKLEVNEADVIDIDITLCDGSQGNIAIKATTLAQIIMDRNAMAAAAPPETGDITEIQVGDGDETMNQASSKAVAPLKMASSEELILASKRAFDRERMLERHGLDP